MPARGTLRLPPLASELALYPIDADLKVDGEEIQHQTLNVLPCGQEVTLHAHQPTRLLVLGGEPLGHRFIQWNFVSSRKERLVQAARDWHAQNMPKVPGETEYIELPAAMVPKQ